MNPVQDGTKFCKFFLKGTCKHGSKCIFKHERPSCHFFNEGTCFRGSNCYFLHDQLLKEHHRDRKNEPKLPIPELPSELFEMIFRRLYPEDILECMQVWKSVFEDDYMWKRLLIAHFGNYESIGQPDPENPLCVITVDKISDSPVLCSWRADYMRSLFIALDDCYGDRIDAAYTHSMELIVQDARRGGFTRDLIFAVNGKDCWNSLKRAAWFGNYTQFTMIMEEALQDGFLKELIFHKLATEKNDHMCWSGRTALFLASRAGNDRQRAHYPSIVSDLLKEAVKGGYSKDLLLARNDNDWTALIEAAQFNAPEIFTLLLEAAEKGDFLKEMLLSGTEIENGDTVFAHALLGHDNKRIVKMLEKFCKISGTYEYYLSERKYWESRGNRLDDWLDSDYEYDL